MYTDPWEQFSSEPSSPVRWQGPPEESDGFFKALAKTGVERGYVRRGEGGADGGRGDGDGDVVPELPPSSSPPVPPQLPSSPQQPWPSQQSMDSGSYRNNATMPLQPDIEALYTNPWESDQASEDESFSNDGGFSCRMPHSYMDQYLPSSENGSQYGSISTLPDNVDASWESSPYPFVQSGQIGSSQDMTGRRTNGTRISQNVRSVSDTLRRNPNRKENTEMAATMAFTSPIVDMPHVVYDTSPSSPSPSPKKFATPKAHTSKPEVSKTTTARKKTKAKIVTAEAETPKTKAPQLTRDQEHQSHISKLTSLETSAKYWSTTGQQCDVESLTLSPALQASLQQVSHLGSGTFAHVHRVTLSGIPLARKTFQVYTPSELEEIKKEVDHVKTLSGHKHIIRLVGTYLDRHSSHDTFYILTFPVADCDMAAFLAGFEASVLTTCPPETITKLCYASGIASTNNRYTPLSALLRAFLKSTLGCITTAIQFMHQAKISHDDIKPANILLRHGTIYITDFGISRNRLASTQTSTELYVGHTHGWTAPEKGDQERHNPFQADIYSLGCVFMHVISLLSGIKMRKDCSEILGSPSVHREGWIREHFVGLSQAAFADSTPRDGWVKAMDLTMGMLCNDRHARPKIENVNQRLADYGGAMKSFHGGCCRRDGGAEGVIRPFLQQTQHPPPKAEVKVPTTSDFDDNPTIRPAPKQVDIATTKEQGTRHSASDN